MQEARSSNPPVITGVCDRSKSRAGHHCSLNNLVVNKTSVLVQMKTLGRRVMVVVDMESHG